MKVHLDLRTYLHRLVWLAGTKRRALNYRNMTRDFAARGVEWKTVRNMIREMVNERRDAERHRRELNQTAFWMIRRSLEGVVA